MVDDDDKPRMKELMPDDLSDLSIEELQDWIAFMKAEISRAEEGIQAKKNVRSGADALFSFGS